MHIKSYDFYYGLRSLPFVKAIYLYGSRAKGTATARSDIDLAIFCPQASAQEWDKIREIIERADTLLSIDYVRLDTLKNLRLNQEIEVNKIILFERKENSYPWYEIFLDLGEAIEKLEDITSMDENAFPYVREAAIQIFEYSFELFWKLFKKLCLAEGFEVNSPRATFQKSYILKLINHEKTWLDMMEDRNLTSHTYQLPTAKEIFDHSKNIFDHSKNYCQLMKKTYRQLKERYKL